jgi:hypothetical protein
MSPSNAKRKAEAISFKATSGLANKRRQERCEGVVSITTKLILRRRLSTQVRQWLQNKRDEHSGEARQPYQRETPGRSGKFMPLISYDTSIGINKK